jgi:hypothetical protein
MSQNSLPDLAQSLGDTLAALVLHPDCPAPVRSAALDFADQLRNLRLPNGRDNQLDALTCRAVLPAVIVALCRQ